MFSGKKKGNTTFLRGNWDTPKALQQRLGNAFVSSICVTPGLLTEQSKQTNFTCVFSASKEKEEKLKHLIMTSIQLVSHTLRRKTTRQS